MKHVLLLVLLAIYYDLGDSLYISAKTATGNDLSIRTHQDHRRETANEFETVEPKVDVVRTGKVVRKTRAILDKLMNAANPKPTEAPKKQSEESILQQLATVPLPYVCSAIEGATELSQSVLDRIPGIGIPIGQVVPGTKDVATAVSNGLHSISNISSKSLSTLADMSSQFPGLGTALGFGTDFVSSIIGKTADMVSDGIKALTEKSGLEAATGAIGSGIEVITGAAGTVGGMVNSGAQAGLDTVSGLLSGVPLFGDLFGSATGAVESALKSVSGMAKSGLEKMTEIGSLASGKVGGKPAKPLEIVQHICKTLKETNK